VARLTVVRSPHHILENRREVLLAQKRGLDARIAAAETRLALARERYEALAQQWHSSGPAVVMTDDDWRAVGRARKKAFVRGVLFGVALPLSFGLLLAFAR
jgi:hypothetical protein